MIFPKLEAYLTENFADDGALALKKALQFAKYSMKDLDIIPQDAKKEFAKLLLDECPPQGPSRKIKTLEDFYRMFGLPTNEIKDTAFQEIIREEHHKYAFIDDQEDMVNPKLDEKFLIEEFWSDMEKTFAKMETLLKIYRAKAVMAEKNRLDCSFIIDALSKEFEELHKEMQEQYSLLREDLGLERKKMRLKGFLSSSVVMEEGQKLEEDLTEEQRGLQQALDAFWQHIKEHSLAASQLFIDLLVQEFVRNISRDREIAFLHKVRSQIDLSLESLLPEYAEIIERYYSDELIRKSAVRKKRGEA